MGLVLAPAAVFEVHLGEDGFIVQGDLLGPLVDVPHCLAADAADRRSLSECLVITRTLRFPWGLHCSMPNTLLIILRAGGLHKTVHLYCAPSVLGRRHEPRRRAR